MNDLSAIHPALTRVLLVGSFAVFAAGATPPALGGVWNAPLEAGLEWIANYPGRWAFSAIAFIFSLILCVAGLAIFNDFLQARPAQILSKIGFYTFLIGALLWIISMGFRLSVIPWAAQILAETSSLPDAFEPLRLLETKLHDIFMVSTFLASSVYGLALLASPKFASGLGWFSVVYGLGAAALFVISRGPIPIMVLVVPLILGLSPLP